MSLNHLKSTNRGLIDNFQIGVNDCKVVCDDNEIISYKFPSRATEAKDNIQSDGAGGVKSGKPNPFSNFLSSYIVPSNFVSGDVGRFGVSGGTLKYIKMGDTVLITGQVDVLPLNTNGINFTVYQQGFPFAPAVPIDAIGKVTCFQENSFEVGSGRVIQEVGQPTWLNITFSLPTVITALQTIRVAFDFTFVIPTP